MLFEKKRKEISVCDIQVLIGTTLQRFGEMGNHSEELSGNSHSLHKEPHKEPRNSQKTKKKGKVGRGCGGGGR